MGNKLQNIIKHIKTMFYNLVSGQFKKSKTDTISNNSKLKYDTRLLKSMDEYKINFDLDSKIAWNRHRMRELFEMYKKIENYYPLFLAFLGFIGIFYFNFVILLINNFDHWFLLTTSLTTIGLIISVYYMVKIMFTKEWCHDYDPSEVYIDLFDKKTVALKKIEPDCTLQDIEIEVRENYLSRLEKNVSENFAIYCIKKKYVSNILKIMLISILIYSFNIVHYKQLTTMAKTNDDTTKKIANESKNIVSRFNDIITITDKDTLKSLTVGNNLKLVDLIRAIVNEEIDKHKSDK